MSLITYPKRSANSTSESAIFVIPSVCTHEGEMWLPKAIAVLPEAFTEQNHMVNSTMKIVRGKVEEYYKDRIEYAYTAEGKDLFNEKNMAAL